MKKILLLWLISLPLASFSQSFDLVQIFRPGIKIGAEYMPDAKFEHADSLKFGSRRGNIQIIVPLQSRVDMSLKNLDIRAKQTFWTINASYREPSISFIEKQRQLYTFSMGITGLKAGLRSGLWFYTAQIGMSEDANTLNEWKPTFGGLLVKFHVINLKSAFIYGAGAFYNNKQFIPAPIFGYYRRFSKKANFLAVLPAQIRFGYNPSKSVGMSWQVSPAGFRSGFSNAAPDAIFSNKGERILLNYRQLKLSMGLNIRFSRQSRLLLEGGWLTARQVRFADNAGELLYKHKIQAGAFVGATLQLNLGKAILDSQNFGVEL